MNAKYDHPLMYVRSSHQPLSSDDVVEVIRQNMFATLVASAGGELVASHLPFIYDETAGEHGTLYAHMARANPHSELLTASAESLVMFLGPHGYISPSWYVDRATAPTWDYVAVHCYGKPRVHEREEARANMSRLVQGVESGRTNPWSMDDLGAADVGPMIGNIVSFEIKLSRVEGKFKLNQGETIERTTAAVAQLELQGEGAIANYIRRYALREDPTRH